MTDVDLYERGARVLSVFGPFGRKTLIEMPTEVAQEMFPDGLVLSGRTDVVASVERKIGALRALDPEIAEAPEAAAALAMAYEIQHPFNSATSKSMCVRAMSEAVERLRAMAPPEREQDDIDRLAAEIAAEGVPAPAD